jgi:hypothetical protein
MAWGPDGALYLTSETRVWRIVGDSATAIVPRGTPIGLATGIAVDGAGNIYVADYQLQRVVRFARDGAANTPSAIERLRLESPTGVALGVNGDVYILDNPPRGVAIWRARGGDVVRLHYHRDWQIYFGRAMFTLLPLLLALQTWVRNPRGWPDWLVWTLVAGVVVVGFYMVAGRLVLFSWLRHLILVLYVLGAFKSYRRMRRPATTVETAR